MCFRFRDIACLLIIGFIALAADQPVLRVCSDPNNLPFSNQKGEGFENRIAELIAKNSGPAPSTPGSHSAAALYEIRCAPAFAM